MIEFEIDGKKYQAEQGAMIIEVADANNINIPRFCYHKKLSIAANCRMCLVEVEKSGKPLPACATPVTPGMKVFTQSAKALDAQRSVMEFLLINHPLDCPICDQGGECELQDVSMGYGRDNSFYGEGKRVVKDKNIGPLIATDMTRCIQCTRCVRFGQEVAGQRELGAMGRGEDLEISTYVEHSVSSELSGNIIDLCPVGALTSKPFRFRARAWELTQHASIAPHDCLGSNIYVHQRRQEILRVVPKENENINETWLSDRDRFSYLGLNTPDRLQRPLIKQEGQWQEVDWQTALRFAVDELQKVIQQHGAKNIGALIHPNSTLEECYLLQKLLRQLGSHHIDHRLHETDVADQSLAPLFPGMSFPLSDLEKQEAILLVGSNIHREQPLAGHRVRKASLQGAHVMAVNPMDFEFHFTLKEKSIVHPHLLMQSLAGIVKALCDLTHASVPNAFVELLKTHEVQPSEKAIAAHLHAGQKSVILLGAWVMNHPQASLLRSLAKTIADLSHSQLGIFTDGGNGAGAWLAGAIPHRGPANESLSQPGDAVQAMLTKSLKAYLLCNMDPEMDIANPAVALKALQQAECVVALSPYRSAVLEQVAHVILPMTPFTETSGTMVNMEGTWQSFSPVIPPFEESKPGWKVLRVIANLFELEGFQHVSSEEVRDELKTHVPEKKEMSWGTSSTMTFVAKALTKDQLTRLTEWPIYRGDNIVRRAKALQTSATSERVAIHIHPHLAHHLHVVEDEKLEASQNNQHIELPVVLDPRVPEGCVFIPAGFAETATLGESFGPMTLRKLKP